MDLSKWTVLSLIISMVILPKEIKHKSSVIENLLLKLCNFTDRMCKFYIVFDILVAVAALVIQSLISGNKNQKWIPLRASSENIHKKEDGSYYVVFANKASSVTL